MANYTISDTSDMITALGGSSRFRNISQQLGGVLAQSSSISSHGYFYAAANLAFLDYLNAFYFNAHGVTQSSALSELQNVQTMCSSLSQPQITTDDYEYVALCLHHHGG